MKKILFFLILAVMLVATGVVFLNFIEVAVFGEAKWFEPSRSILITEIVLFGLATIGGLWVWIDHARKTFYEKK